MQSVDLVETLAVSRCRGTVFPVIVDEVAHRIPTKAFDLHGARGSSVADKFARRALARWAEIRGACELLDPPVSAVEVAAARSKFAAEARDLSGLVERPKDRVPGDNDLRILLQGAASGPSTFILARDAHFVGYADLIEKWYGLRVLDALLLPELLEEWRASA